MINPSFFFVLFILFSAVDIAIYLGQVLLDSEWFQETEELGLYDQSYQRSIWANNTVSCRIERDFELKKKGCKAYLHCTGKRHTQNP